VTDGTAAGTAMVADIAAGLSSSSPTGFTALGNGMFVFSANDVTHGAELWATDGTAAGTVMVADIAPGFASSIPGEFTAVGDGTALFSANDGTHGVELWRTDGTLAGTFAVGVSAVSSLYGPSDAATVTAAPVGGGFDFGDISDAAVPAGGSDAATGAPASSYPIDEGASLVMIDAYAIALYGQS
jgi:ELWxxDGT repeat protein